MARGVTRQLVSLPTGSGKTVIMSHLAKQLGRRTLVLSHRTELQEQTLDKMRAIWPTATIGVLNGKSRQMEQQVVVASIYTAVRKETLKQLEKQNFEVVIIDEAHHAPADSYIKIVKSLGFDTDSNSELVLTSTSDADDSSSEAGAEQAKHWLEREEAALLQLAAGARLLVGFTATPFRLDGESLGRVFQLEVYVNTPQRNALTVQAYQSQASGRKAIVFCVGVQHLLNMRDAFLEAGLTCEAVHGKLEDKERAAVLQRFKTGETQVVTNCMVLTEGFDEPSVDCIVMARPTKSTTLYMQCIGRGLRPHPGKSGCIVLDLTDNHHDLSATLFLGDFWSPGAAGDVRFGIGGMGDGSGGDRTQAKINLGAVQSGELGLLNPHFGWVRFGDTNHFVLNVFAPNVGGQWYVWLLACRPLDVLPQPDSSATSSSNDGSGVSGSGGSGSSEPRYAVRLLKCSAAGYAWHGTRRKMLYYAKAPPAPSSLEAALCWAEGLVRYDFEQHVSMDSKRPMTAKQMWKLREQWGPEAELLTSQQLSCGQAATLIGLKRLTEDYMAGQFKFLEYFCWSSALRM